MQLPGIEPVNLQYACRSSRWHALERDINLKTCGRIRDLQVHTDGPALIITGSTQTYYAKQLATQIAREWDFETPLTNEIVVN